MDIFGLFTMLGGLGLFLYGMDMMGDGLTKLSGGKLEKILEKLTSNLFMQVLLGVVVTGIIQSSSATTVMVVGFVNSGIMKLKQAVGIIMGANIGTTVTAWILSLAGIDDGGNIILKLLKPSSFAPLLAIIGVVLILYFKEGKKKDIGIILAGFAILMIGMDIMSGAVEPLANEEWFCNLLVKFSNPILGVAAGAILTGIIQSSSASVGILQAFSLTGAVSFGLAIPIIMGQNIGTCVTAIISAIGAEKNAKRAALIHLSFNLIGTVVFLTLFYGANFVLTLLFNNDVTVIDGLVNNKGFAFLGSAISPAWIATIHSIFNVCTTLMLLPFSKLLIKIAEVVIKDNKKDDETEKDFKLLDVRFLDQPAFAIEQCVDVTETMAQLSKDCMVKAISLIDKYDSEVASEVRHLESEVDKYEDELGTYLMKISGKSLSDRDSRRLSTMLHVIGNFERISDHAINVVEAAEEMNNKNLSFSDSAKKELSVFKDAVIEILDKTVDMFKTFDVSKAKMVEPLEEVIDDINIDLRNRHIERLTNGECTIEMGFVLSDISTSFERVADHCSNIAVCVIQVSENSYDTHEYLDAVKRGNNEEFKVMYTGYKTRYMLP